MFNLKQHKSAQIKPYQKYLRDENLGPQADDNQAITEKELPHRQGDQYTTTEDQIKSKHKVADGSDIKIIEKILEEVNGRYVNHRSDATWLPVPPINALVEKMRQDRLNADFNTTKESHWSQKSDKKQFGALPKWPKTPEQHDKIVLNNDPRRFEGVSSELAKGNKSDIKPLIGDITIADINRTACNIKAGAAIDYDTAIVAILREADRRREDLNEVERRAIQDLKIARTKMLLKTNG